MLKHSFLPITYSVVVFQVVLGAAALLTVSADFVGHKHGASGKGHQAARSGRQETAAVAGGIDFSGCVQDAETGLCCVEKEETVTSLEKEPILECTHKNVEQCHYSYVTQFTPSQEEVCEENFEKTCQITFKQVAFNDTVNKCYKPVNKVCNGQGPEECRTVYESACTTKYVEKQPGKFVGDTSCEKLPVEICGAGCSFEEGAEECHEKVLTSLVDVPEEVCDLNPQKVCKFITKLVPKLKPEHQCTIVPKETCTLKFTQPKQVPKPLLTKWCLDSTPAAPGDSYDETNAAAPVIETEALPQPSNEQPSYEPAVRPDTGYLSPGAAGVNPRQGRGRSFQGDLPARSTFQQAQQRNFGTPF